jgi:hypothetical protein
VRPIYWFSITPAVGVLKLKYFYGLVCLEVRGFFVKGTCRLLLYGYCAVNSVHGRGVGLENPPLYIDKKSAKFYTAYVDYYMC